ncbi:hypothetical protein Vadar_030366 [Vaccinium darrowii]|uniref:Uncharacterized protein n=1 Tax=Vaccinium darrowii TaxID=229202 RepID=A0ACB7ZNH9_9ERIC|nr:hypothetical protein Vadar_030366 [Vaccinium darrowii]
MIEDDLSEIIFPKIALASLDQTHFSRETYNRVCDSLEIEPSSLANTAADDAGILNKGSQLYDPKAGGWLDLGMLDVLQIFGRAGRPQFDKSGEDIIITTHE